MDNFLKRVYVMEVKSQATFATHAIMDLNESLKNLGDVHGNRRIHSEVFRQTHSFLTHASNVSRLFWPPRLNKKKDEPTEDYEKRSAFTKARGKALRELFAINEQSPLKNRDLRDHLEHYDERLDHWSNTSQNRNICSDTIGPPNAISGIAPTDTMRWFDPTTNSFLFRGEKYELQALVTEVTSLPGKADVIEKDLWDQKINHNYR